MSSDWRPSASQPALRLRARLLRALRAYFDEGGVLEVTTPVLSRCTATDPHLTSIECQVEFGGVRQRFYLQTSPEFAMKRLLAADTGAIYQVGPAFRDGEWGPSHNPEFTVVEWYRPGYDLSRLMDDVDALLQCTLGRDPGRRVAYRESFQSAVGIDPISADRAALVEAATRCGLEIAGALDRDALLDVLFTHRVQPCLGRGVVHVHGYPASQAALARIEPGEPSIARRVEVFVDGVELGNGYEELTDPSEQRARFESDRRSRDARGSSRVSPDERLLAALDHGLPNSAGIALGFDRLVMVALGASRIDQAMAFPIDRA